MQYILQPQFVVQNHRNQDGAWTSIIIYQPQEISSLESVTSQGRDVTRGIEPRFVYQITSLNYYEPVEHWKVDENTCVDVFEKTKENYPKSFEYAQAQVNALDEVPQSYLHQRNLKLDQTRYIVKTRDHEYEDLNMIKLLSRVCTFYEE